MLIDKNLWQDNGVETIEYKNYLWLNERNLGKSANYNEIRKLSIKYDNKCIKQRKEFIKNCKKQCCRKFIREDLAVYLLLHINRVPSIIKFRSKLGFKNNELVLSKECSIIIKLINAFSPITEIIRQHNVLYYYVDLYLPKYKLVTEIDELGHNDRDNNTETIREKEIKDYLKCKFIRINTDKPDYDISIEIGKINKIIKEINDEKSSELQNLVENLKITNHKSQIINQI